MKKRGLDCVYLDVSHKPAEFLIGHFPNIYARCLELGIDITRQPIPVVPAAHYTCGGVKVDQRARTDVAGLYAVGETSLHGIARRQSAGQQFAAGVPRLCARRRATFWRAHP
jgi:L-aspartate oxidase